MRTLVSTFLVGISLAAVAAPALAQQHPWVPSDVYAGTVGYGQASQRHYQGLRAARGSVSSVRVPVRSAQPEATFHAISAMP